MPAPLALPSLFTPLKIMHCHFRLSVTRTLGLLTLGLALIGASESTAVSILLDPAVRHTNGMRTATSKPLRASSVNWTCNPDKLGYCGGVYYWPCIDSIRPSKWKQAGQGCGSPSHGTYRSYGCGPTGYPSAELPATSIESAGMTSLGQIPSSPLGISIGAPVPH